MSALQQKRDLMCEVERLRSAVDQALGDQELMAKEAGYLRRRLAENRDSGPILPPLSIHQTDTNTDPLANMDTMNTLLAFDPSGRRSPRLMSKVSLFCIQYYTRIEYNCFNLVQNQHGCYR